MFKKIAEYFDVSYDYLLGDTEKRKHENALPSCDELGLTQNAIEYIKIYDDWGTISRTIGMKSDIEVSEVLSNIITNNNFGDFLIFVGEYIQSVLYYETAVHLSQELRKHSEEEYHHWRYRALFATQKCIDELAKEHLERNGRANAAIDWEP